MISKNLEKQKTRPHTTHKSQTHRESCLGKGSQMKMPVGQAGDQEAGGACLLLTLRSQGLGTRATSLEPACL